MGARWRDAVRRPPTRREHTEERCGGWELPTEPHPPHERERHMHRIPEVHTPRENSRGVSDCGRKPHEDRGDVVWIVWGGWCECVCVGGANTRHTQHAQHAPQTTNARQPETCVVGKQASTHHVWDRQEAQPTRGRGLAEDRGQRETLRADPTAQRCQTIHIPIHTQRCG